ncbi:unnamed protein product [Closterium sp. NIES-53]
MGHGRTSDIHDHANAALSNPILLWRGRKREGLADAPCTTEGSQTGRGKLPASVSPARDLSGARELVTPRVGQAAEAALSGVQAPALLTSTVAGRGLATALLLLARTTTGTTPLRRAATSTTAASATSASAASTDATDASSPHPHDQGRGCKMHGRWHDHSSRPRT